MQVGVVENFVSSIIDFNLTLLSLAMSDETSSEPADPGSCDPPTPWCCWEAEGSSEPRTRASMSAIGVELSMEAFFRF